MKAKLSRDQAIVLGALVLLLVTAGALGWFGLGGLGEQLEQAQALTDQKGSSEISAILGRSGGIAAAKKDIDEIAKISQSLGKLEEAVIDPWHKGWEEASGVGMDWSTDPGKWKDKLVSDNDEIMKRCGRPGDLSGVVLGENFYLGMGDFKQRSPSVEQVPALARQLSVAKKLVELLIAAKKGPEGYATSCVLSELEVPLIREGGNPEPGKSTKNLEEKSMEYLRETYRLRMACSPEVLYHFVRLLNQDNWLFIINQLSLVNERDAFPKRGEIAKLFQNQSTPSAESPGQNLPREAEKEPGKAKLLLVISGKERVDVSLEIDYVGWKSVVATGKPQERKK